MMNSHYNKLIEELNKCRINRSENNNIFTHTSLGNPIGCYNIPDKTLGKFNVLYSKAIIENNKPIYLTEKHKKQGPILIDLDFKYNSDSSDRILQEEHYLILIEQYILNIIKYIKLEDPIEDLKCYILTKPKPSLINEDDNTYKDGVHIIFPNICTQYLIQYLIRENVIKFLTENKTWESLNLINDISDVIDRAVIEKNNWLMYGSCKPKYEDNKYTLNKILTWNSSLQEIEFDDTDIYRLPEDLSIRKFNEEDVFKFNDIYDEEIIVQEYEKYTINKKTNIIIGKPSDINLAIRLIEILNPKRAESYESWLNIGFCLHNISDELLNDWIIFSQKSKKYKNGECEKLWKNFKNIGYSIASLHKWAMTDNFDKYMDIMIDQNFEILSKSICGLPYDVARSFFELYKHNFRIGSLDCKEWYYFCDHRWIPMQDAYIIKDMLNEDMVNAYLRLGLIYGKKAISLEGGEKTKMLEKQSLTTKISMKLRGTFKKQVIEELATLYKKYDPNFTNRLDENKNIVCFLNGVYDLENGIFREGRADDYVTICTNINYIPYDKLNKDKLKIILKFLEDIQPEEDMRNYILDLFASCLAGNNLDQKFNIWTGSGSNGKSLLVTLMTESLGDYSTTLPPEVLTRASMDPDKASPTMAKTKGKRIVIFEEPENTDQIYVGKMKAYSGGVKIQARKLHKDVIEFYPQFKMFLLCNKLPNIPSNDGGTWRRIRLVPFEMKFVDNPMEDYERLIDRNLEDILRTCKEEFLSLLIERYKVYKVNSLQVPKKVMAFTERYQSNSDIFLDYINECLTFTNDIKDKIDLQDITADIQYWLKNIKFEKRSFQRNDIKSELEEKIGKSKNSMWKGWKMKPQNKKNDMILMDEENLDIDIEENDIDDISTYEQYRKVKNKKVCVKN